MDTNKKLSIIFLQVKIWTLYFNRSTTYCIAYTTSIRSSKALPQVPLVPLPIEYMNLYSHCCFEIHKPGPEPATRALVVVSYTLLFKAFAELTN